MREWAWPAICKKPIDAGWDLTLAAAMGPTSAFPIAGFRGHPQMRRAVNRFYTDGAGSRSAPPCLTTGVPNFVCALKEANMSYELLIGTGGDGTDQEITAALINEAGQASNTERPAAYGSKRNNYERGSIEIFDGIPYVLEGRPTRIRVNFGGSKWHLGGLWLTDKSTGETWYALPNIIMGSDGSGGSSADFDLVKIQNAGALQLDHSAFRVEITTAAGSGNGTNDPVFLKIFDGKGGSNLTMRPGACDMPGLDPINDWRQGTTQACRVTAQWPLGHASHILLAKYDTDPWRPTMVTVQGASMVDVAGAFAGLSPEVRHFSIDQMLDKDHNKWVFIRANEA